ncbi:MAG TPA: ABC transporter permease [Acidimicrobiales bacterium]|nr:ABC transporter permease [Acidimicrobiales bacterium]
MRQVGLKLLQLVPVLFLVSVATFSITELLPGDPAIAILGENATPETIAALRQELRLDDPIVTRYVDWAGDALRGDLGISTRSKQPVTEAFRERLPVTLQLAVSAIIIGLLVAIPLGAWSAFRAGRLSDRLTTTASFALVGLPPFLMGLLLVYVLAVYREWFPVTGWVYLTEDLGQNFRHAFLPSMTLALTEISIFTQLLRADMFATLQQDFVLAAKARGLPTHHILLREALRPSSFSLITLAGVNLGRLLGGTVIIEHLFAVPGIGRLVIAAIFTKDYPVLQGSVLMLATAYLLLSTLIDLSYAFIDPRIRRGRT